MYIRDYISCYFKTQNIDTLFILNIKKLRYLLQLRMLHILLM